MISDGYPVPTVAARVGGAKVTGFASDSSPDAIVNRVELSGPGPRTAEGLGVGSTLGQLQSAYGVPQASESDCVLMVWFDTRPGLNFHLEYPAQERRDCGALSEPPLPASLRVASIPFNSGMATSITTRSGRSVSASSTASRPVAASPTISRSGCEPRIIRNP